MPFLKSGCLFTTWQCLCALSCHTRIGIADDTEVARDKEQVFTRMSLLRCAGAMKYLAERYDLTKIPMAGASGGALAAVLAACGVDADDAIELAYKMRCVRASQLLLCERGCTAN